LEQALRLRGPEADVAGGVELVGEPRCGACLTSGLQLLDELSRVLASERHAPAVAGCKEALELLRVVHSPGFSGVPGRPSGNISANRFATPAGTRPSTFPPNEAIYFTPLEETKLT